MRGSQICGHKTSKQECVGIWYLGVDWWLWLYPSH
jgi:hypothetical protein